MVSVSRRGCTFKVGAAVLAAAVVALGPGSSANAQLHGVQIGKSCVSPRCVFDTTDCLIQVGHADGFDDTIQVNQAFDVIEPAVLNVRVPAVGNLPIVNIEGNAFCSGVGCDQSNGVNCVLPCRVGPANSVLSGLPGDPNQGIITFRSNTYVIQPTDPQPLRDQANVEVQDLCDEPTTSGCSKIDNIVQFTASTVWCDEDDENDCTQDTCVNGVCDSESVCTVNPNFCNDSNVCTADTCDGIEPDCCSFSTIPCPPQQCRNNTGCDPILGCQYTSVCTNPTLCNDNNVCTNDICDETEADCCENPAIPCPPQTCFNNTGCHPVNGCQYQSVCTNPNFCNDNNVCTSDVCSTTAPGCCTNTTIPCEPRTCFNNTGCNPTTGCQYQSVCAANPNFCNDNNVCTTDVCSTTAPGCCTNTPIVCPPRACFELTGCNPITGCQYDPICSVDPDFCDDNNVCTADTCDVNVPGCCDYDQIPCPPQACFTNTGCHPINGCQYQSVCANPFFCNDNNPCTQDICDEAAPNCCRFVPECVVAADCQDDGNQCTTEVCVAGCCDRELVTCPPPSGPCEFNECNPLTGLCDSLQIPCNDGDECTEDVCDPIGGCRFEPIACCKPVCEPVTKAHFDVWNENERKLSGTFRCIASWDQELLSRYTPGGLGNNLLRPNLQTDKGKARIDGLQSQQCEENCIRDPAGNPLPVEEIVELFGAEVDVVCTESAPLLGVAAKILTFPGGAKEWAGSELVGMGNQAGQIAYDLTDTPPPAAAAGVVTPADFVKAVRSGTRGESSTPLSPEQGVSPVAGGDAAVVGIGRGSTTQKGSLIVYSKVEIKWDANDNVIQDTFVTLTNDHFEEVTVQLYFVHGDLCTWVDNAFTLTPNQSVYWSVLTGQPLGASPFTALEERCPDDDPENPGGVRMRGYVLAWAVERETNREIRFNHLSGTAMLVNYRDITAWEYNPWAFQATEAVPHGAVLFPPFGRLDVNGIEYQFAPDQLLLDFFAAGAVLNPANVAPISLDTDLTLWIFDADLRENPDEEFPKKP